MKSQNTLSADDARKQIQEKAAEYFACMHEAQARGRDIAGYSAGAEAMMKLVALAGESSEHPKGAYVPTVIVTDASGNKSAQDLFSMLLKERIVLLDGQVEPGMATVAIASLLYLDSDLSGGVGKPITVQVNSPGGSVLDGQAIYDTIRSLNSPVNTVGVGLQASMGSILLAAGDTRKMSEGSKLMIHSIGSETKGKLAEQENDMEQTRRLFVEMKAVYIRHIGLTAEFWDLICAKDTWLTANQALKMGFIDEIVPVNAKRTTPFEKAATDFLNAAQDKRNSRVPKTVAGIKELLLGTSADEGMGDKLRAECIVALSQMPEFWTPELKKLKAKAAAASANDNKKEATSAPSAKAKAAAPMV